MKEVAFRLEPDEDGWPPVGSEWIWLEEKGRHHVARTAPLFVPVAVDDEIEICETNADGEVTKWKLVAPSDRSLIWLADLGGSKLDDIASEFRRIGCNTARLEQLGVAAIDVPPEIGRDRVDEILDRLDEGEYAIAFPCDRQE